MKKIVLAVMIVTPLSTAFYAVSCCSGTTNDDSQAIILNTQAPNNTYIFSEQANPTTGFDWYFTCTPDNIVDVQQEYEKTISKSLARGAVGVGGRTTFTITGKQVGQTQCTFEYKRSWEKDKTAAKTTTLNITITDTEQ